MPAGQSRTGSSNGLPGSTKSDPATATMSTSCPRRRRAVTSDQTADSSPPGCGGRIGNLNGAMTTIRRRSCALTKTPLRQAAVEGGVGGGHCGVGLAADLASSGDEGGALRGSGGAEVGAGNEAPESARQRRVVTALEGRD